MPIYEYECKKCNAQFELLLLGSQQPACPTCETSDIEKLLSVPSAPSSRNTALPVQSCQMPRCCGGGCQE